MNTLKNGDVRLTFKEFNSLVTAFLHFQRILEINPDYDDSVYFTTEDLSSLSSEDYDVCNRVYKEYYHG